MSISRRDFIRTAGAGACVCGMGLWPSNGFGVEFDEADIKEIRFYTPLDGGRIRCDVCPRLCQIADLERGYCGNKENRKGKYYSLVYSRPCTVHVDPIEKKPLFHVLPGTQAFSIATAGCNIECDFCQNWQIAQFRPEQVPSIRLTPEQTARKAKETGCRTIAYTYSEPVTFYDYMLDTAVEGKKQGVGSVVITNGFINEEPLKLLCENVIAVKVDLKAFTEKFYKESCHGELKPVKDTLARLIRWGMWTEIVVLIVPTLNDSPDEIRAMVEWISGELSPDTPRPFHALPRGVQDQEPSPDAPFDPRTLLRYRKGKGAQIRVPGKCPRTSVGKHPVPQMRQDRRQTGGLHGLRNPHQGRSLRIL